MSDRLDVRKTYKLYIAGGFPRSESGRTYPVHTPDGSLLAQACRGSRKDVRDAVKAARGAQASWAGRTAYNRAQILYRVAEVLEGRRTQFVDELTAIGADQSSAEAEVDTATDRWVWYAGWADKIGNIAGTSNPVAGPYFNFTVPEPMGVVGIVCPDEAPLLAFTSRVAPAIVGGNTAVVLASEASPLVAIDLAEVLATSDVPGGVVNIITGLRSELVGPLSSHADVNAIDVTGCDTEQRREAELGAAESVTRVVGRTDGTDWLSDAAESPYAVTDVMEIKTVWHPIGR